MMHELIRYATRPVYKVLRREAPKRFLTLFEIIFLKMNGKMTSRILFQFLTKVHYFMFNFHSAHALSKK